METETNSTKRQRRLKGEGSVYQTIANGRTVYVAAYTLKGENGRRTTVKGHGGTPQEAIARRQANFEARAAGGGRKASKKTLKQALTIWNEENTSVKENKLRNTRAVEHHIIKRIGNPKLSDITTRQLKAVFEDLEALPQKSIARNAYRSLRAILEFSIKKQWISSNPLKQISEPRYRAAVEENDELQATDRSKQYVEFLTWLDKAHPDSFCWVLFMSLGLRIGEICGLEFDSLNDRKPEITINRTFVSAPSRIEIRTKNKRSRTINMPVEYYGALTKWLIERPEPPANKWYSNQIFTYTDKKGIIRGLHTNKAREKWKTLLYEFLTEQDPELTYEDYLTTKYYRPHFNRHITASNLAGAGIPVATAMAFLGHMDSSQTEHYTHILESAREQGGEAIATAVFGE